MCYIFVKQSNQKLSSDLVIGARHLGNRDGAGCMYVEDGRVQIEKIMPKTDDDVRVFYEAHQHRAMAFHVRNQSLGPVNMENAHPFWVTNMDWGHPMDIAMMHNGTVSGVQIDTDLCDTANIATHILRPLFARGKRFVKELFHAEEYWYQLSCFIGTNKFVFLNNEGEFIIVNPGAGRILEESGVWVSGKAPLKPVTPDNKSLAVVNVEKVESTPASKVVPLRPDNVSWEFESDNKLHLRIARNLEDEATEVADIQARLERESVVNA